ncbi:tetrapyrrole biosynthesis, uroporphyrinogen III synthase [Amylocystis lapponica]|nr:tetrapyrrole biosynthesis, uroporphyrinogen III synthase [Amylocystis lapponica]
MTNVLLLRSPAQDAPDKYEDGFRSRGYHPVSVPVLGTVLKNLEELKECLSSGHLARGYGGVIITSRRACEAWSTAAQELTGQERYPVTVDWAAVPFYAVGEVTAKALADIREVVGDSPFAPREIHGGAESGTSERLAHFIVEHLSGTEGSKRFLYLTGDKNRDTLPRIMSDAGFELESLQVYATQGSSTFAADLQKALDAAPQGERLRWWIVYFAPSAAEFVTPLLRHHFILPTVSDTSLSTAANVAAIGPTTSAFLLETLRLRVDVTASKPSADSLVSAVVVFDGAANAKN